jgi:hypothetical protein
MTERATRLQATADEQIAELIGVISGADEAMLRRPCPGRQKLGDGTVGACARHTADNYRHIATFVQTADRVAGRHERPDGGRDERPRSGPHADPYTAGTAQPGAVVDQLSDSRDELSAIARLTDGQLDAIPPKDSFRFCDGQRTLEQVLAGLLHHQRHQLDALRAVTA